jgi:hypothetical protein
MTTTPTQPATSTPPTARPHPAPAPELPVARRGHRRLIVAGAVLLLAGGGGAAAVAASGSGTPAPASVPASVPVVEDGRSGGPDVFEPRPGVPAGSWYGSADSLERTGPA